MLRVRSDILPENMKFSDDGCRLHPSCLSCPEIACKDEFPNGAAALRFFDHVEEARKGLDKGESPWDLAERLNISIRSAYRTRERCNKEEGKRV